MAKEYWNRYWEDRRSRRRFLGGAAVAGVGAASLALVGCGDDDDSGGTNNINTPTAGANPTATPANPFAGAKKGGTFKTTAAGDPPTIDPMGNTSFQTRTFSTYVYSRLFRNHTGPGIKFSDVLPEGDLVQTAEVAPDGLKWTLKMKPGITWHNVAPVSGRALSSDDLKYSWGRMTDPKNTNRSNFAFVDKVEYPDNSTMVFTLSGPNSGFKDLLADTTNLIVMPNEADGKFDPAKTMIGTGPWLFDSYTPSVSFKVKRNPAWFDKGSNEFPLLDAVETSIIPDYANRLAQFLAGNTDVFAPNNLDLVDMKKKIPDAILVGGIPNQGNYLWFDSDPTQPWNKDERVRQAISMCFSRDQIGDVVYNTTQLRAQGVDIKTPYNNIIPAGFTRFWLDPQGPDQGDSAKFYKFDVAGAKALLSAAGFADGFSATYQYPGAIYGKAFNDAAEATITFLNGIGIKTTTEVKDYTSQWISGVFQNKFKGIAFGLETGFADVGGYSARLFTPNPNNHGNINDPQLVALDAKQRLETDEPKRKAIFWDMQRLASQKMYYIPSQVGAGTGFTAWQPWVKNAVEFQTKQYGSGTEVYPYWWLNR